MIVCSCNVLTDHDVRTALAAERTPRTTGQVYGCLGAAPSAARARAPSAASWTRPSRAPAAPAATAARAASTAVTAAALTQHD
jgi:bacterioferritin-associated ferredoxin